MMRDFDPTVYRFPESIPWKIYRFVDRIYLKFRFSVEKCLLALRFTDIFVHHLMRGGVSADPPVVRLQRLAGNDTTYGI